MIKINLVREGRAVRGAGAAPTAAAVGAGGPAKLNTIIIGVLTLVGVLAAVGYWFVYNRRLTERRDTVRQRQADAQKLEAIIRDVENYQKRKESLQRRIDLINQLKANQKGPVRIMDQISKDLPDLVWLDAMTISTSRIQVRGRGLNPNAIANFVENIKNDPFFEEPQFDGMNRTSAQPLIYSFGMSFTFSYAPKNTGTGSPDATDTAVPDLSLTDAPTDAGESEPPPPPPPGGDNGD